MVICPDCGKDVKDAKFCSNCGAFLPKADEVGSEEIDDMKVEIPIEEVVEMEDVPEEIVVDEPIVEDVVSEVESAPEEIVVDEPVPEEVIGDKKSRFCPNCGTEVSIEAVFCPDCGFKLAQEEKSQTKFCQSCGKKINIDAEICPHCGARVANATYSEEKNTFLAAILSFLFPGLGHLYLGLNKKGVSFIIAYIISGILTLLLIGFVLVIIIWLWALIDSIKSTEAINRGEHVEDKLF